MGISWLAGAAAVSAILAYQSGIGIEVDPIAVADFNGDGADDILTPSRTRSTSYSTLIEFHDGRYVTRRDGSYLIHGPCTPTGVVLPAERQYVGMSGDANEDGKKDLILKNRALESDIMLYNGSREVYLGDGKGNFAFSQKFSESGR